MIDDPQDAAKSRPSSGTGHDVECSAGKPAGETDVSHLTPEEQMALYEKDLKETDWGHQPC